MKTHPPLERANRGEWQRRVDRWKDSGLTAKEFAAERRINAGTRQFWRYTLTNGASGSVRRRAGQTARWEWLRVGRCNVANLATVDKSLCVGISIFGLPQ